MGRAYDRLVRAWIAPALLLSISVLAVTGCGEDESEEKTFRDPAFPLSFKYPGEFEFADDISLNTQVGGDPDGESKGVRLDEENGIVLQQFTLTAEVTASNLERVKPELDGVVGQAARSAVSGKRVTAAGLPGYLYVVDVPKPAGARSRLTILFDGRREYTINCQFTKSRRREIERACRRALGTLELR